MLEDESGKICWGQIMNILDTRSSRQEETMKNAEGSLDWSGGKEVGRDDEGKQITLRDK